MEISTIIVDDEQPALDELRYLLSAYEDINIIAEATSSSKALKLITEFRPDLVFLDIQMPNKNGFEIVAELEKAAHRPMVIFATAFDHYAVEAFEKNAIDYILKPLSTKRLNLTISKIRKSINNNSIHDKLHLLLNQIQEPTIKINKLSLEKDGKIQLIPLEEVAFCHYEDTKIFVNTVKQASPLYGITTMDKLEEQLAGSSFFRIHRGIIVNLDWVSEFSPWYNGKYNIVIKDNANTELTVSRTRVKDFKQRLGI
ncbi:MAG: response regulator [Desulfotalea sp.]